MITRTAVVSVLDAVLDRHPSFWSDFAEQLWLINDDLGFYRRSGDNMVRLVFRPQRLCDIPTIRYLHGEDLEEWIAEILFKLSDTP